MEADKTIQVSSGIDRLFGTVGFFAQIQSKSVKDIIQDCESQSKFYRDTYQKYWFYNETKQSHLSTEWF